MHIPNRSIDLIDLLDQMFPEVIPEASDSIEKIMRQAGKRELVHTLKNFRDLDRRAIAKRNAV